MSVWEKFISPNLWISPIADYFLEHNHNNKGGETLDQ